MKTAEELLAELVAHVRPPKVMSNQIEGMASKPNYVARLDRYSRRYCWPGTRTLRRKSRAQLRHTDPQVDWSAVNSREGSRRIILYVDKKKFDADLQR